MSLLYRTFLRPAVFLQDSERAHSRVLSALSSLSRTRFSLSMLGTLYRSPDLPITVMNIDFPNPLGLAAGMDKNGEAVPSWQSIGYGFCEIGGVTSHEQPGNPKPRMFRASKDKALINRMGFNNIGARGLKKQFAISGRIWGFGLILRLELIWVNPRKTPLEEAPSDYAGSIKILWKHADFFFVINVSSPNTPGLRDLQSLKIWN